MTKNHVSDITKGNPALEGIAAERPVVLLQAINQLRNKSSGGVVRCWRQRSSFHRALVKYAATATCTYTNTHYLNPLNLNGYYVYRQV